MVGEEGFEPPTLWSQTRCATKLRYSPRTGRILRILFGYASHLINFFLISVRSLKKHATNHKM